MPVIVQNNRGHCDFFVTRLSGMSHFKIIMMRTLGFRRGAYNAAMGNPVPKISKHFL